MGSMGTMLGEQGRGRVWRIALTVEERRVEFDFAGGCLKQQQGLRDGIALLVGRFDFFALEQMDRLPLEHGKLGFVLPIRTGFFARKGSGGGGGGLVVLVHLASPSAGA